MNNILSFSGGFSKFKTCMDCVVMFSTFYDIMHVQSVVIFFFYFSGVFGVLLSLHSINLQEKELGPVNFAKVQGCSKVH